MNSFRWCGIALISATLAFGGPAPGPGYLARIGPGPLRVRITSPRVNPASVLPPLNMGDDEKTNVSEPVDPNPASAPAEPLDDLGLTALPEPDSNSTVDANTAASIGGTLVPQALLQYFNRGTNQPVFISVPVEFTPPSAPARLGSSATYISQ